MGRLRLAVLVVIVATAAVVIVWRVVSYTPKPGVVPGAGEVIESDEPDEPEFAEAEEPSDANLAKKPSEPAEARKPKEEGAPKESGESGKPAEPNKPGEPNKPSEPNKPAEPNEPMESLNLKDVEVKDIIQKLAEWTGKAIIPVDDALQQKITIYVKEKLPRSRALSLIYSALREKGIVAEAKDDRIILRPIKDAKLRPVPTVPAEQPLASIANKDEIVEKFFKLENCRPTQLQKIIQGLLPEHGYAYSVDTTGQLVVIDTVMNLLRIERIIKQLDVPETQETVIRTFEVRQGDPVEIVQLLNLLLGGGEPGKPRSVTVSPSSSPRPERRDRGRPDEAARGGERESQPASAVVIGSAEGPITLIPISKRKWIIAKASAGDMVQIEHWIGKLDEKKPEEREHTLRQIDYADVSELTQQINNMLQQMPLKANVMVQALPRAKQLMIIGSEENRSMVEKLIDEIDVPIERFKTEHIKLKYADPEVIKKSIEELYTEYSYYESSSRFSEYRGRSYQTRGASDPDMVRVIAYPTLKQVTVIASAGNMDKVKQQIAEWDRAIDVNEVAPLIIQLQNTDPVKMATLLTTLFTETRRERSFFDMYFGGGGVSKTIVGPLYGQMAFEAVEDTRKIIVISKVPEGYDVVKKLVAELDKKEIAEVPLVVVLKYADPEDLAERLNAIFNEAGTVAPIRRSQRGLSDYTTSTSEETTSTPARDNQPASPGEYSGPWSRGRPVMGEMPISRVIGRVRFIPDPRTKSILVLTPSEYLNEVRQMIKELDQASRQVRIKAIIVEIDHRHLTSLGLQLASNPLAFGTLDEEAITALTELTLLEQHGSLTVKAGTSVTGLIDFLVKRVNGKILNQQTLWTKDNEEADFFKGQNVAFTKDLSISEVGGRATRGYTYEKVGMTLRVRPIITPEKNVDMRVNLNISQRTSEFINEQPVRTEMNTETGMIIKDGETIMLGGMLFQEDSTIERKIPLIGDLPLLGGLFRHNDIVRANTEMLVFVTPYVVDEDQSKMLPETLEGIEKEREKLQKMLGELQATLKDKGL